MTKFVNIIRWLALCLVFLAPSHSFGFGLRLLTVSRRTSCSSIRLQMALKDGAQEKIATIRTELAVMESLSSAEQDEETMHTFRTILSCANALQEIDRDMETFQVDDILSTIPLTLHVNLTIIFLLFVFHRHSGAFDGYRCSVENHCRRFFQRISGM